MKKAYIPDNYEQEQQILSIENGSHALILQSLKDKVELLENTVNELNRQLASKDGEEVILLAKIKELEAEIERLKQGGPAPEPEPTEEVLFHGNFDNGATLIGSGTTREVSTWGDIKTKFADVFRQVYLWRQDPPHTMFEIRNTLPYTDNGRPCLYGEVVSNNPAASGMERVQISTPFNNAPSKWHSSSRYFYNPEMRNLTHFPENFTNNGTAWWTVWESWMASAFSSGDGAGSARITLSIVKDKGVGQPLYWRLKAEQRQPSNAKIWEVFNKVVSPQDYIGKWFTCDVNITDGQGLEGRAIVKLKLDGGQEIVLFDVKDTTGYPGRPDIKRGSTNPLKFYIGEGLVKWLIDNFSKPWILFNDFKWYK